MYKWKKTAGFQNKKKSYHDQVSNPMLMFKMNYQPNYIRLGEKKKMKLKQVKMRVVKEETGIYYDGRKCTSPGEVEDILLKFYEQEDEGVEKFSVLALDSKNKIIGVQIISVGTINQTVVHPREVFKFAISSNANSIFVAHNHPSGDTYPSKEDISITKRIVEAGDILGIKVLDHFIVGDNEVASLVKDGFM